MYAVQTLFRYYPLTPVGTALLLLSLRLLGISWNVSNVYALSLSTAAIFLTVLFIFLGRLQAFRYYESKPILATKKSLRAGQADSELEFELESPNTFLFFRLHLKIKARILAGRGANIYFISETHSRENKFLFPFFTPISGSLLIDGKLFIRDIFGVTRTFCSEMPQIKRSILPNEIRKKLSNTFIFLQKDDAKKNLTQSEDEKFYMREYTPGDKLRDINWKAAVRTQRIITLTSPRSREQSFLIQIHIRNYRPEKKDGHIAIAHLEHTKGLFMGILEELMSKNRKFEFDVRLSNSSYFISSPEDLEKFEVELGKTGYVIENESNFAQAPADIPDEIFVFSTPFDTELSKFLYNLGQSRCHLFLSSPAPSPESHKIQYFPKISPNYFPGYGLLRSEKISKEVMSHPANGSLYEESLHIRLF